MKRNRNNVQRQLPIGRLSRNALLITALLLLSGHTSKLGAQEEGAGTHEEEHHDNAVALFLGGATHLGSDGQTSETGFAIGLEYARHLNSWLRIGLIGEYASTDTKRDFIVVLPLFGHLTKNLVMVVGPGVETASEDDGRHTDFLMRFGAIYEFEFNNWAIGPQINADIAGGHWTLVYGVTFGIGF